MRSNNPVQDSRQTLPAPSQPVAPLPALASLAYTLARVGVVAVLSLTLMYALELDSAGHHVFGPISDIAAVPWNLLLLPLVVGFGIGGLPARGGRLIFVGTIASSVASSVGSTLLVVDVLSFEAATTVSVTAVMIQFGWLFAVSRRVRGRPDWSQLSRLGRLIGLGACSGGLLFGASFLFGWATPAQIVVMVAGLIPGLFSWFAWPVWVFLLGRRLSQLSNSTDQRSAS